MFRRHTLTRWAVAALFCLTSIGFSRSAVYLGTRTVGDSKATSEIEKSLKAALSEKVIWLDPKMARDTLQKEKLEDTLQWVDLFSPENWDQWFKRVQVGFAFYATVYNYAEVSTKKRAEVHFHLELVRAGKTVHAMLDPRGENLARASADTFQLVLGSGKEREARKLAIASAVRQVVAQIYREPPPQIPALAVVGNRESKLFHLPQVSHSPKKSLQVPFPSIAAAEKAGYTPCPIDFPVLLSSTEHLSQLEALLGSQGAGEVERRYRVIDGPDTQRVERVAARLLPLAGRPELRFRFRVLDTDLVNAFALPNGIIYVTRGILKILESDDEIAAVLAHEFSHVVRSHAVAQYKRFRDLSLLGALGNIATQGQLGTVIDFAQLLVLNGYDRRYEREADRDGLLLLYKVGISPQAFLQVFRKLRDLEGSDPSKMEVYFRTHPSTKERLKRAQELIQEKNLFFAHLTPKPTPKEEK